MGNEKKKREKIRDRQGVSEAKTEGSCKELEGVGPSNGAGFEVMQPIQFKL